MTKNYKTNDVNMLAECINNDILKEFVDFIEYHTISNLDIHYNMEHVDRRHVWCEAMRKSIRKNTLKNKDRRGIVLEYLLVEAREHQDRINELEDDL